MNGKTILDKDHFFYIVNYETILRDQLALNKAGFDFLILDEAQRIKISKPKRPPLSAGCNLSMYSSLLVPSIENRLIDIFSIVSAINPYFFGPLWEFSYQHCLFDPEKHNKINGYYNLQS